MQRAEFGKRLRYLGELPVATFCRDLHTHGVSLQLAIKGQSREFTLESRGVVLPLKALKLEKEFPEWLRRWDELKYPIPLRPDQQDVVLLRQHWIRLSAWSHDLPRCRWSQMKDVAARLGVPLTASLMTVFFNMLIDQDNAVTEFGDRCGMSVPELMRLLGRCEFSNCIEAA